MKDHEKHVAEEAKRLAKEQKRKIAYLAKEEANEKTSKIRASERAEKRTTEETEQLAKDQTRKKIYFAREQDIADAEKARKLKG